MIIKYEPFKRVYLFGGTPLIAKLAQRLKGFYEVHMYTAPRQAADVPLVEGVTRIITTDINDVLEPFEIGNALGVGLGEAWRFGPKLREAFGTRLVDFMSIPYPNYLGGAHLTHAILRGERRWGCAMQLVTENTVQGEVHDGPVIYSRELYFPLEDEHHELEREYLEFLEEFIELANEGLEFKPETPRHPYAYLPRLNTERQGWVDWQWVRHEIIRFIRGFDAPYPGARTTVSDGHQSQVVTLHDVIDYGTENYHSFHAGLIFMVTKTIRGVRAYVATRGGAIAVTVRNDIGKDASFLKPGMRLHTDSATLDKAKTYVPQYSPVGDIARKEMT